MNVFEHGLHGERLGDFAVGLVEALVAILIGALFIRTGKVVPASAADARPWAEAAIHASFIPRETSEPMRTPKPKGTVQALARAADCASHPLECGSNKSAMSNDARRQAWRTASPSLKLRGCPDRRSCSRAR